MGRRPMAGRLSQKEKGRKAVVLPVTATTVAGQGGQSLIGGVSVQLRNSRRQDCLQIPLPLSSHGYAGEWFYAQNLGDPPLADRAVPPPSYVGRAPVFTSGAPTKRAEWEWGRDERHANQVELLLERIDTLRRRWLTSTKLVYTFLYRRVQPLRLRQHGIWGYIGIGDPDRSLPNELSPEEGLGTIKPSVAPLPEDAAIKANRKRKREADARAEEEREKRHQRVRQQKLAERARRVKERGDSPTPPTDPSNEEWSSDTTKEAVPLAGSPHPDDLPKALLVMV
ncbi:hypothetical protein BS78_02G368200 [Paspalum vaginatum]|nr:hypothetical protein BS78_02G368200 [Paspalum vaginatum]